MTKSQKDLFALIAMIVLIGLAIIFAPFLTIWSLNTLFPVLSIPYNFWTWLAVVIMNVRLMSKLTFKRD